MTLDDERQRVALHEAGHAYVAWRLGRTLRGVTVVPGRRWAGSAHYGVPLVRGREWARLDPSRPFVLWPAAVRRSFETKAMTLSAGEAAEWALWWPTRGAAVRTSDPLATQLADAAPLSDADRVRLVAAEVETGGCTDAESLAKLAAVAYPDDLQLQLAWVGWAEAEAKALVTAGAARIERLAAAALDRGRLSGKATRGILEAG